LISLKLTNSDNHICPLCGKLSSIYAIYRNHKYYKCSECYSVFLSEKSRLDEHDEKKRYMEHNNDINDARYCKFVSPLTNHVINKYNKKTIGLDFGAGTGPVISSILDKNGYKINKYDPFFFPDNSVLSIKYDYIVCCEVIEHFFNPKKEFLKLYDMLKFKGELICKTDLFDESIDFNKWYYKNDPAHVFFYSKNTFSWIAGNIGFNNIFIEDRIIIMTK